jgi:CspA family cold shock protein
MSDAPANQATPPPSPEAGTIRWFDVAKKIGVILRQDGSTLFIPPYGLSKGQSTLAAGQPVSFIVREGKKGPYAAEVMATSAAPPSIGDLAAQLAADLGETSAQALSQLRRVIKELGPEAARHYVAEAQRVEAAGGLLIPDGSRRRTLGGVFFVLVRQNLTDEQRAIIFPPLYIRKTKKGRPAAAPTVEPPPAPPLGWEERIDIIETLKTQSGKATSVKVTLIGRPNQIEELPQVTLLTLTHAGPLPALPKGIPIPDPVPATTYSVYISKKQWKNVAEAITNPEDALIVEGTQVLDPATGTISVFVMKATTKLLQQASKQPRPAEGDAAPGRRETA